MKKKRKRNGTQKLTRGTTSNNFENKPITKTRPSKELAHPSPWACIRGFTVYQFMICVNCSLLDDIL